MGEIRGEKKPKLPLLGEDATSEVDGVEQLLVAKDGAVGIRPINPFTLSSEED